jgi:hypothetical protein
VQLVDYSWSRPSPATIAAAGYAGALRYLSGGTSKDLTPAEAAGLHAAGLAIGLVWETSAGRAGQGFAAGVVDAHAAEQQAAGLGYPSSCVIFYAVDFAALPPLVAPYFAGVMSVSTHPVGVYGSADVVDGIPAPFKWQTAAWSGGRHSTQAHLYQRVGGTTIPGTDVNDLLKPLPLWGGASTISNLIPGGGTVPGVPTITPLNPLTEDDMAWDTLIPNGDTSSDGTPVTAPAWTVLRDARVIAGQVASGLPGIPEAVWAKPIDGGASAEARLVAIQTLAGYASDEATKAAAGGAPPTVTVDTAALAQQIAAAIPAPVAQAVADILAKRLAS